MRTDVAFLSLLTGLTVVLAIIAFFYARAARRARSAGLSESLCMSHIPRRRDYGSEAAVAGRADGGFAGRLGGGGPDPGAVGGRVSGSQEGPGGAGAPGRADRALGVPGRRRAA